MTVLHLPRNRTFARGIVWLVLVSWLALLGSAACTMPLPLGSSPEAMSGCPEQGPARHPLSKTDCAFQPCLDSRNGSDFAAGADRPPELPPVMLYLVWWIVGGLFLSECSRHIPRCSDPPSGRRRRIPLIYRFCILLN